MSIHTSNNIWITGIIQVKSNKSRYIIEVGKNQIK